MKQQLSMAMLLLALVTCSMQACSGGFTSSLVSGGNSTTAVSPSSDVNFESLKTSIFSTKCQSCHTEFETYTAAMASGYIVAGSPSTSLLYQEVSTGAMPQGGTPLSTAEVAMINVWILEGAPDTGSGSVVSATPTPTPSPTPTVSATPDPNATYAKLYANLFAPKCLSCHNGAGGAGGFDISTYTSTLTQITPGNATGSTLYQLVKSAAMPPGGGGTSLTLETELVEWIDDGALNN